MGEGVQDIAPCAGEGALVTRLHLALEGDPGFLRGEPGVDRHRRGFFGEQNPVTLLFRQVAPGHIDVVAQGHEDVAQILALPGHRPGGDGTLAYGQARVRDHQRLGDLVHPAQAMALRTRTLWRVRGKVFGVEHRLARRVTAGARIQHADQARQSRHAAHRGTRARRAPLLLQGHRGRQAFDGIDIRHAHLIDQASRIRRHGFEIAALCFGVQRRKRQGRLS